ESCHISPVNQPIKYHFSATSSISFPKRLVSISIVFSSFLLVQNVSSDDFSILKSTREYSTAGDQICSFNITDATQDRKNPTLSWKASSLSLSASSKQIEAVIIKEDTDPQLIIPTRTCISLHIKEVNRHEKDLQVQSEFRSS
ncbi:unnamed protein product, partial [Brassica oleracea]